MNIKQFKLLNLIAVLAMLLGLIPVSVVAAPIKSPEMSTPQAPLADQYLTGSAVEGNLRILVRDTGTMNVDRYVGGSWQSQIFGPNAKGSRLYYNGNAYTLSKESTWVMNGTDPTQVSNTLDGNTITTVWAAGSDFRITQTTTYNDGNSYYRLQWDITNVSGASILDLRFFHGEDTYLQGGDNGAGWWDAVNTTIGVQKDVGGTLQRMYLQGVTTPYGYDSLSYSTARNNANASALSNTVDANESTDNGYALEWREASLADGATWTIVAFERFTSGASGSVYVIAPVSTDCDVGTSCDVTYQVSNPGGSDVEVNLSVSGDQPTWNPTITSPTSPVTVPASSSINAVVQVSVPAGTANGTVGNFTLTATPTGGGDAASDIAAVQAVESTDIYADLAVSKAYVRSFDTVTYTIAARNLGPDAANGAVVYDDVPAHISNVFWSCTSSGGATCGSTGTASGFGNTISETLAVFPAGGVVTFTVTGSLGIFDDESNIVTISAPSSVIDTDGNNDTAAVGLPYKILLQLLFLNWTY